MAVAYCEQAEGLLRPVASRLGVRVSARDVLDQPAWEHAYAERIPVLRRPDTGRRAALAL
ncbi:MAG: glutaredoxin family protein [Arhodomonas sp.]|nr:glutaredoxin family protein [Arhodomonas sp.]